MNLLRLKTRYYLPRLKSYRFLSAFSNKHIGNNRDEIDAMLQTVKSSSLGQFVNDVIPSNIKTDQIREFPEMSENSAIISLTKMWEMNKTKKNLIGLDFNDTILPPIIQRKILENPKWYTAYTPYQSEISQGRLEAQFNFQTLVTELTGMEVANISLLDSGSAATEALNMAYHISKGKRKTFFCTSSLHPVILDILKTRAKILDINLVIDTPENIEITEDLFGFMFSYPDRYGVIKTHQSLVTKLQENNTFIACHTNLLSLLLLKSPGELGVDLTFGTAQNFGIPIWFGGPHPAFFATHKKYIRQVPGRIIGKTIDAHKNPAYRIALQTREQHIKKDKATSNICTSQSLLSVVASMYAIYHGRENLIKIASEINTKTKILAERLLHSGVPLLSGIFFDTITLTVDHPSQLINTFAQVGYNARVNINQTITLAINETITHGDINRIGDLILNHVINYQSKCLVGNPTILSSEGDIFRNDIFLDQGIFNNLKTETELTRYIHSLEAKDYTLTEGMIPLGSCTMKLNATSELVTLSDKNMLNIHPYGAKENSAGYREMISELTKMLTNLIGLDYISYQSNSGAMGEYSGLLSIREYHNNHNGNDRNICLIPESAHGTNFASAKLAGFQIKKYNDNIPFTEFKDIVAGDSDKLACLMITYPNTYGIFDNNIKEICQLIHEHGGLVYMDGANMNAQVGITNPGECGADVCHLNLHKTFCIPHGGGGPGMGPILVNSKLRDYLPCNIITNPQDTSYGAITMSEYSSASILSITYQYLKMMGSRNLRYATEMAILNANYLKEKLQDDFTIYTTNENGRVGHEFIITLHEFNDVKIKDVDIAKRLIDYSFHPPTMSWPVPNSLMIEPTESESKHELDRFISAMKNIRIEIDEIREGKYPIDNNVLKNSPHNMHSVKNWTFPYTIEKACFPVECLNSRKFWPAVSRVNDLYGDKNLVVK